MSGEAKFQSYLKFLETNFHSIVDGVDSIRFNIANPQHTGSICLYCAIIEHGPSLLHLYAKRLLPSVPLIVRSIYEAEIDLNNVLRNSSYVHRLEADFMARMINVLQAVHDREQASFLDVTGGKMSIRALLKQRKKELQQLKQRGFKPIKNVEKFELAGRLDEYFSAYQIVTGYSHNDISSLQQRHVRDKESNPQVVIFDHIDWSGAVNLIDLSTALVCGATRLVHEFFDTSFRAESVKIWEDLQELRRGARDQAPES